MDCESISPFSIMPFFDIYTGPDCEQDRSDHPAEAAITHFPILSISARMLSQAHIKPLRNV